MNNYENNYDIIGYTIAVKISNELEKNNKKLERISKKLEREIIISTKLKVREEWLNATSCPYCNGNNIHKKDKRARRDYTVQRLMCMGCRKIFQRII